MTEPGPISLPAQSEAGTTPHILYRREHSKQRPSSILILFFNNLHDLLGYPERLGDNSDRKGFDEVTQISSHFLCQPVGFGQEPIDDFGSIGLQYFLAVHLDIGPTLLATNLLEIGPQIGYGMETFPITVQAEQLRLHRSSHASLP
jgi:hypothetical protein